MGAYGIELVEGVSAAGPFPSGTKLYIEGIGEYVVQDTTSEWVLEENDHKLVDIYFNKHQDAVEFGAKHKKCLFDRRQIECASTRSCFANIVFTMAVTAERRIARNGFGQS